MKKAAIIIAFEYFQDREYFITKQELENKGVKTSTFSSSLGTAIGSYGGEVKVDKKIEELSVDDFDAVVFIGGGGAFEFINDLLCHKICQETVRTGKVLSAICIAPVILAKSGVLKNKKATVWTSPMDKSAVKILKEGGADYTANDVEVDGKIVTGNGPASAEAFGKTIAGLLG